MNHHLTALESDILSCLIHGESDQEISENLSISLIELNTHMHSIMIKINCYAKADIIACLKENALLWHRLHKRYVQMQYRPTFMRTLGSIAQTIKGVAPSCYIESKDDVSKQELSEYLSKAGIDVTASKNAGKEICLDVYAYNEHPYNTVLEVITELVPAEQVGNIINSFYRQYVIPLENSNFIKRTRNNIIDKIAQLKNRKISSVIIVCLIFSLCYASLCQFYSYEPKNTIIEHPYGFYRAQVSVRMAEMIDSQKKNIKMVVLTGIGGCGKSVLARQYAKKQQYPIVSEIDATTPETVLRSLDRLSELTARTEDEKKELACIRTIKNYGQRRAKLTIFLQEKLKDCKKWCLVFDNLSELSDLQDILPLNSAIWGSGKIIITTRNTNIKENQLINPKHIIEVPEFSKDEGIKFLKELLEDKNISEKTAEVFFKQVPPYPLDIILLAHYINQTGCIPEDYAKMVTDSNKVFFQTQDFLAKGIDHEQLSRFAVISKIMNDLININPDFLEVLFAISVAYPGDISKNLLKKIKDCSIIDQFIYHMRRYGLLDIREYDHGQKDVSLYMHDSIQEVIRSYLKENYSPQEGQKIIDKIVLNFSEHFDVFNVKFDSIKIRDFLIHWEEFLKNSTFISSNTRAAVLLNLGQAYHYLGSMNKAKAYLEKSLHHMDKDYVFYPKALSCMGVVLSDFGDYNGSQEKLELALSLHEKKFPLCHRERALIFINLGRAYIELSDYAKAKKCLDDASKIAHTLYEENHPLFVLIYDYLGRLMQATGEVEQAIHFYEDSIAVYDNLYGHDSAQIIDLLGRFALSLKSDGQHLTALSHLSRALQISDKFFPDDWEKIGFLLTHLGDVYTIIGDFEKARKFLTAAVASNSKHFGPNHIHTVWSQSYLGHLYVNTEEFEQAKPMLENVLAVNKKTFKPGHPRIGYVSIPLILTYAGLGEFEKAQTLHNETDRLFKNMFGEEHPRAFVMACNQGRLHFLKGNYDQAEKSFAYAFKISQKSDRFNAYRCFEYLGDMFFKQGKIIEARQRYQDGLNTIEGKVFKNSVHMERLKNKIKDCSAAI